MVERRMHLLRHAKSSWKGGGLADHDRPLAHRGRRAAGAFGHNPGLEQLALLLARRGSTVQELEARFPTGALATLTFRGPGWAALDHGTAELVEFIRPRDLV